MVPELSCSIKDLLIVKIVLAIITLTCGKAEKVRGSRMCDVSNCYDNESSCDLQLICIQRRNLYFVENEAGLIIIVLKPGFRACSSRIEWQSTARNAL